MELSTIKNNHKAMPQQHNKAMLGHACSSVFSNFNKERFYGLLTRIGV